MFAAIASVLFPPKCILCRSLLTGSETDLCHACRTHAPELLYKKRNIPFIAQWTAVWYYKDNVRKSIHRYKFYNARSYADAYARNLAVKLTDAPFLDSVDLITWAPTSFQRRLRRGYDQSELLARALSRELALPCARTLRKIRHTPAQSSLREASQRKANILGVYKVPNRKPVTGKQILLVDDVLTTGATASECARMLLTAGAKEVFFAAVAVASHDNNK